MNLGNRLRKRRKQLKRSGGQVALKLGISTAHVSDLENGKSGPSLELLVKLADYYETTTDWLLGRTEDSRPLSNRHISERDSELLDYLSGMSQRAQQELLSIAKVLYEIDQRWQKYEFLTNAIEAMGGHELLEQIEAEESAALRGITLDRTTMVFDVATGTIRIVPLEEESPKMGKSL